VTLLLTEEFGKEKIVIMKFGSQWCDSCHALEFELKELDDNNENVSVLISHLTLQATTTSTAYRQW
jgi:thiol-disulfide isomerase/thioredoxin